MKKEITISVFLNAVTKDDICGKLTSISNDNLKDIFRSLPVDYNEEFFKTIWEVVKKRGLFPGIMLQKLIQTKSFSKYQLEIILQED